ncbi:MAG TPA: hypothetical protein VHO01_16430 [Jatrophihabitans sp.]|nr:hypothetical protein [Jatrophihabitans sp.]
MNEVSSLLGWPVERLDGSDIEIPGGRIEFTDPLQTVKLVLDSVAFDFHMDASPTALSEDCARYIAFLFKLGFEVIDEDECPPELLANGWTRIYLAPIVPVDDTSLIEKISSAGRPERGFGGLASGAAAVGAVLLCLPFFDNLTTALEAIPS